MKRIFVAVTSLALTVGSVAAQDAGAPAEQELRNNRGPGTQAEPGGAGAAPPGQTPPENVGDVGVPVELIIPAAIITGGVIVAATNGSSSSTNNTSTPSTN